MKNERKGKDRAALSEKELSAQTMKISLQKAKLKSDEKVSLRDGKG